MQLIDMILTLHRRMIRRRKKIKTAERVRRAKSLLGVKTIYHLFIRLYSGFYIPNSGNPYHIFVFIYLIIQIYSGKTLHPASRLTPPPSANHHRDSETRESPRSKWKSEAGAEEILELVGERVGDPHHGGRGVGGVRPHAGGSALKREGNIPENLSLQ